MLTAGRRAQANRISFIAGRLACAIAATGHKKKRQDQDERIAKIFSYITSKILIYLILVLFFIFLLVQVMPSLAALPL